MKIGILTFHRAHNYGAVLQGYAMQQVLRSMGHDAYMIDYREHRTEEYYRVFRPKYIASMVIHPRGFVLYWLRIPQRRKRKMDFEEFQSKFLHLSAPCFNQHDIPPMDVYIVGSDQVWNPDLTDGFDEVYLGNFDRAEGSKLLTYAVSGQVKKFTILSLERQNQYLRRFSNLSLRENTMAEYISHLGLDTHVDIDPTLLTEKNLWESMIDTRFSEKNYVLLYNMRGRDKFVRSKAKLLAKRLQCTVVDLSNATCSPVEFVSYFRYARYVVTSSFHGTAFSLIFERPLYSILFHERDDDRYEILLRKIGADSLLVDKDFDPQPVSFDYTLVRENLKELRKKSLDYLKTNIESR